MRVLRFDGQRVALDARSPEPAPAPGEAVVRVRLAGIATPDLAVLAAGSPFRGIPGHEFVGVVEELNIPKDAPARLDAKRTLKGKRVVGGINLSCQKCDRCRSGLAHHCAQRTVLGLAGRDGCFADRFTIPAAALHAVPDAIDDEHALFATSIAAAMHAAQMFRVEGRPYITVLGDGRLGLLAVQVMARLNASVRLLGKHPEKLELCDHWGVKHRHIDEVGRRQDQDVVVDCTGSTSGLALAMQLVRPRGKIVLASAPSLAPTTAGIPAIASPIDLSPLVVNEIELIGSRCGQITEALAALTRSEVDTTGLITRRGKLDDGPMLIEAARAKGQIKVVMAA
ncbi:MAG: alcohol dehydrogenase catalytic domain-containing protein [Phycisphaerales bacterium]